MKYRELWNHAGGTHIRERFLDEKAPKMGHNGWKGVRWQSEETWGWKVVLEMELKQKCIIEICVFDYSDIYKKEKCRNLEHIDGN